MSADHDALRELVAAYALGALDPDDRAALEAHLRTCLECRRDLASFGPVVTALAESAPQVEPRPELRARVMAIAVPVQAGTPAGAARSAAGSMSTFWGWITAAASIVLAIGLGGYTVLLNDRVQSLERRLADADAQLAQSRIQVADARRALGSAESSVAVLLAPDLTRVDLAGQEVARAATGRAYWSRARGLVFAADNLPALPAGKTYQLWLVTPQAPVSAGLLAPDASGRVTTRFETPAGVANPVAMAVTLEPEGGVPSPTGEKYLVGAVN